MREVRTIPQADGADAAAFDVGFTVVYQHRSGLTFCSRCDSDSCDHTAAVRNRYARAMRGEVVS